MQVATETQIKASDLRINNWVRVRDYKLCVKAIYISVVSLGNNPESDFVHDDFDYSKVQPIPLTTEILEKAGFEWETQLKKHLQLKLPEQDINGRKISFYYNDGKCEMLQFYMDDYFDGYFETKPPKYLHQLQNLYHSLTGEEIQLSL